VSSMGLPTDSHVLTVSGEAGELGCGGMVAEGTPRL
jgi:hypothetical protein